jgi:NAD(P)-dependent dehydrogenase (short-subunit alcohol dehydrogenase family)
MRGSLPVTTIASIVRQLNSWSTAARYPRKENGMHILLVDVHPEPTSFRAALKNMALEALRDAGHTVLDATVLVTQAILPHLTGPGGRIINFASALAFRPIPRARFTPPRKPRSSL